MCMRIGCRQYRILHTYHVQHIPVQQVGATTLCNRHVSSRLPVTPASKRERRSHESLTSTALQSRTSSTNIQQYIRDHQGIPIHRLSAVSLLRSLRAGDRGLTTGMAEDSSDNAFSFAGHAAAPAAGTQSNSSQSIDTGGSDNSELRTQVPRRTLVAPRGRRLPPIPAIEDADSTPNRRLRWLQGLRRSLHPRIHLHRLRMLHHRESDHTRR